MILRGFSSECAKNAKRITCTEKKKTYAALNPAEDDVSKFHVDGALIQEGLRCDYLVLDETKQSAIYVELKGENIRHALDQISRTEQELSKDLFAYKPESHHYRIVCSHVSHPLLFDDQTKKWRKAHKGDLVVKATRLEEDLRKL